MEAVSVGNGQMNNCSMSEQANALDTMHDQQQILKAGAVRRLTPLECERLQGFPDGWTLIGEPETTIKKVPLAVKGDPLFLDDGDIPIQESSDREYIETEITEYFYYDEKGKRKKCSDSARYKALGNSIAIPFWFYLMRRIAAQYERPATLGSLFDGIGGFPLCWERCNGPGTAIWASEIEEFPIAVTKRRFPENIGEDHD